MKMLFLGGRAHGSLYEFNTPPPPAYHMPIPSENMRVSITSEYAIDTYDIGYQTYMKRKLASPRVGQSRFMYVLDGIGDEAGLKLLQAYLTEAFIRGWTPPQ